MAYESDNYKPNKKSAAILARAWEHVRSVPYKTTARWLFYRLLQDGIYSAKEDYKGRFLPLLSRARHNAYALWKPNTLADDSRERVVRGVGFENVDTWAEAIKRRGIGCNLDKWEGQRFYVQLLFEASAMASQFKHYTKNITLVPFGGMPSIPFKWEIAKSIEEADRFYGLDVKILYFGDYDPAGMIIPETSIADIRKWCEVDFDVVRVGLNEGDGERYGMPENPDKPGTFQWEGLSDPDARAMIQGTVERYVDLDVMAALEETEASAAAALARYLEAWEWEG